MSEIKWSLKYGADPISYHGNCGEICQFLIWCGEGWIARGVPMESIHQIYEEISYRLLSAGDCGEN